MNETKIDHRKSYFVVLDVETANMVDDPLCYDVGFAVCDKKGNIYESYSYLTYDIFCLEKDLMKTAYYSKKIPMYEEGIKKGIFRIANLTTIRWKIKDLMDKYNTNIVAAYNAYFDRNALNSTLRYITKSEYRWFLPYGTKVYCIWSMACQTIFQQKSFVKFAVDNNLISKSGNIRTSAEVAYAYITNNPEFEENHTGLKDVEIEAKIMAKCFRQHKKMKKTIDRWCWRIPTANAKEKGWI